MAADDVPTGGGCNALFVDGGAFSWLTTTTSDDFTMAVVAAGGSTTHQLNELVAFSQRLQVSWARRKSGSKRQRGLNVASDAVVVGESCCWCRVLSNELSDASLGSSDLREIF